MKLTGIKADGYRLTRDGKLVQVYKYRDASAAIRARKSKKVKPVRRVA